MIGRREFIGACAGAAVLHGMPETKYRLIDSHVHVWKADPQFPWAKETKRPPAEDRTPEMLLELMKANGVEKTVIIQVIHYRWDNSYLASVLKQYPQYFRGVARVDPNDPKSPDHLSKLVQEQGFRGVRLSPGADESGDWIKGALMPPLWRRCRDLKVPMTILAPATRLPDIQRLAESLPDLTVVIDHMADCPVDQPEKWEMLAALAKLPKVFVKISHAWSLSKQPYPWLDVQELQKRLLHAFGAQRLMWGTDWPIIENSHAHYAQALTQVRDDMKFLSDEDKSWILSKTVQRVWPFS
jgi:L-fuconolactonase